MIRYDEITAVDWQLELGGEGAIVEGRADIEQCLRIIVNTPRGSVPLRPGFGCDAWRWLDAPLQEAQAGIARELSEAIRLWEPRAELVAVKVVPAAEGGRLAVQVQWRPAGGSGAIATEVLP